MEIELIIIGNEILSGDTRDANGPWLSKHLENFGQKLYQIKIIPDTQVAIFNAL